MIPKSWGIKRMCSCGKGVRFYDLNKKEIDCPECGEIINIEYLSTIPEKDLLKPRSKIIGANLKEKPMSKKEKIKEEETDTEKETTVDIEDTSKIPVKEIIGKSSGKVTENIKEEGEEDKD